jgi:2-polyprenyl-3-methyl-5-hydroxy-6-metoxy-1,4-benzoquinol methylase
MNYIKKIRFFLTHQLNLYGTEHFYDKYANTYKHIRDSKGMLFNDYIEFPAVMSLLQNKKIIPNKMLDIGCGTGFYTRHLAGSTNEITAIDVSHNMLELAHKYCKENLDKDILSKINFQHTSLENYRAPKKHFDLVLGTFMLGYFQSLDVFFKKIKYLITDNGRLIVSTLHPIRMFSDKNDSGYVLNNEYFKDGMYESDFLSKDETLKLKRWTFEDISKYADINGFLIERCIAPTPNNVPEHLEDEAEFYKSFPSILIIMLRRK